ncbi:Uncharacterised protein [BD1-7 clade bacterium]|uniref:PilZ domain-containing protein n=1 Tax=BD1-7 clade bacterium TaxID=2029982 RepID=A0A5S9P201_9GAMM|nr:Uncharacterised protein [BD1-7 clade bacterium]CAA0094048.1 Uncharacterised protein [BD1-7 clade bacterium]CAA0097230.1 Uncharacterised protein [BD1-7 clade bacterium]CAA0122622.1 Uncharacterised protein [BD1-7 clade bacterium]
MATDNNANNNYTEKRSEKRIPLHCDVTLVDKEDATTVTGRCCNLSTSGMLVQLSEHVKVGTLLDISLTDESVGEFEASGEIIRVVRDDKLYLTAIKFQAE